LFVKILHVYGTERNNRIFRHEEVTVTHFIAAIKEDSRLWVFAGAKDLGSLVDLASPE
jgi:hypothetical protein